MRPLLAVSLVASFAAFGCTTNLNPGNGTPTRIGPELRTAPTSGVTSGSETRTPPPMTSSYTRAETLPTPRTIRRSANEAAAIMAGRQAPRGRYLGPANPGPAGRAYASDRAGGFVNPAMRTNPQITVNSSISSPSTPAVNSGAGVTGSGVTGVGSVTATGGAVFGGVGTAATTTAAGIGLPAGALATARPTVTDSIANNPAVTTVSGTSVAPTSATAVTTTAASTGTSVTAASTGNAAGATTTASANGTVRILRGTSGGVTITNGGSTSSRNQ